MAEEDLGQLLKCPSTQNTARVKKSGVAAASSALSRRTGINRRRILCQKQRFCVDFMLSENIQIESKAYTFFRHVVVLSQIPDFTDEIKTRNSSGAFSISEVTFSYLIRES